MNFVSRYNVIPDNNCGESFVGMNSGNGFIGFYGDVIKEAELKRLYVIKGAAGTGKSTFMCELAKTAEASGFSVNRYFCSSDHNSLDAVIVADSVAVIDGTNPHSYELKYPGAISEILDYTKFWDNSKLIKCCDDILKYTDNKSNAYSEAYSRLKCEMNLRLDSYNTILKTIDYNKMESQIHRFISQFSSKCFKDSHKRIVTRSVGMNGRYMFPIDVSKYKSVIKISDVYGSAYVYMTELARQLSLSNIDYTVSLDPVCPTLICEVIIPSEQLLITIEDVDSHDKTVNMSRFVEHDKLTDVRGFLRLSAKCTALFAEETDYYLSIAGEAHFTLEKIYGKAMNFDFLNTYSEMKIKEIINNIKL